ncbi:isochorismatase family protein [Boeremia exigua]|uniref:isochorismatase family protein n=1 Tax=Boeremia exigua TaxID=749465 RepID=UPI001E8EAADC|nr:isochorismatase family protein [Boeremia exigua]KAH6644336.1 isochorismatase family protein [Boeremia exigua]
MPQTTQIPSSTPYAWPHDSTLSPTTTALLIIDMQHDFLSSSGYLATLSPSTGNRFTPLIPTISHLLTAFRRASFPVIHTREGHEASLATVSSRELHRSRVSGAQIGAPGPLGRFLIRGEKGHDIIPELAPLRDEVVIDKPGRGAFANTELEAVLRAKGVRNLVVCGVTADACVSTTVREASDRGYDVLVVADGVESINDELKKWSLEAFKVEGGLFGVTAESEAVLDAVASWYPGRSDGK